MTVLFPSAGDLQPNAIVQLGQSWSQTSKPTCIVMKKNNLRETWNMNVMDYDLESDWFWLLYGGIHICSV